MQNLLLQPQNGEVGLKCPWNRPPASSRRKRPNEWSGCRQLASGIISFVACRLIPQLPPPHQSRGAVGTAGAITGWGCARRKLGTGGMLGALPCRLQLGGWTSLCSQLLGPLLSYAWGPLCHRASLGSSNSTCLASLCPPAVLPSRWSAACIPPPSSPSLARGVQYFLCNPELLFHLVSYLQASFYLFHSLAFYVFHCLSQMI